VFIILARETIITGLRTIAAGEGLIIQARDLGKQKTALQMVGIWCLLIHYDHAIFDLLGAEALSFHRMGLYFLYLSVFFSVLSAGEYFLAFFRVVAQREAKEAAEGSA
jgi:CDP-diacylglycerol--glycerol-3-phosphate 3-phosphatidyltransferase